ncbi:hypothetical protein Tco_1366865 [Tanacetum coccineum]
MNEFPQLESGLVVPVFSQEDDPIACLNKAMAFLSAVAASRVLSTNNQLRTSSNLRNQVIIQDDKEGRQELLNAIIFKLNDIWLGNALSLKGQGTLHGLRKKAMLAEAHESGQILDEEQLAFLADLGILDGEDAQTTIPNNAAF